MGEEWINKVRTLERDRKIEKYKKCQLEVIEQKTTITKWKNTHEELNNNIDEAGKGSVIWKKGQWNSPKESNKKNSKR